MRTFYIFKIKKELSILTKDTPYSLFKIIDQMYYLDTNEAALSFNMYNNIFDVFNNNYINNRLVSLFKHDHFYSNSENVHIIDNKYRPEYSLLKVYKSHMVLKSDAVKPTLLLNYLMDDNLFVCDFKNKDYFWLNEFA